MRTRRAEKRSCRYARRTRHQLQTQHGISSLVAFERCLKCANFGGQTKDVCYARHTNGCAFFADSSGVAPAPRDMTKQGARKSSAWPYGFRIIFPALQSLRTRQFLMAKSDPGKGGSRRRAARAVAIAWPSRTPLVWGFASLAGLRPRRFPGFRTTDVSRYPSDKYGMSASSAVQA